MKLLGERRLRLLSFTYRGLIAGCVFIGLVIIAGTIYGLFFHAASQDRKTGVSQKSELSAGEQGQAFTGIGRIRISTADPQPEMAILFVSFIYYPEDIAFSEELAHRIRDFREIILDYIGSFTGADLRVQDEEIIKTELLRRFNAILRLGQIETLFFSDFMII